MDEENKILNTENSVEISNLDDVVSENYMGNELNESTQNVEGALPKKKGKLKKVLFIILWILGVLFLIRLAFVFFLFLIYEKVL